MSYFINKLEKKDWPPLLNEIPDKPKNLFFAGQIPDWNNYKILCVVGSRKYSSYGKSVLSKLLEGLRGQKIIIISGLALGIDALAHEKALEIGLKTIAVPGSGLGEKVLYPKTNFYLANKIINNGGALISEFEENFKATLYSFAQRNRIMAGMSDAILIIEAEEKSGTLITARLGGEYNRDVLVVPGPINSSSSVGTNKLLKDGANPILDSADILEALDLKFENKAMTDFSNFNENERKVFEILKDAKNKDEVIEELNLEIKEANILLATMELKGLIKEELGKIYINI